MSLQIHLLFIFLEHTQKTIWKYLKHLFSIKYHKSSLNDSHAILKVTRCQTYYSLKSLPSAADTSHIDFV